MTPEMLSIAITISALRIMVLIIWMFYAVFERDARKLMWALAVALLVPNVVSVIVGLLL